jgi:glycosyltransferase involved in cell wall biosynthesis
MANDRIASARIVTIYNGVDTTRFSPPSAGQRSAARARLGLGAGDFVVGMLAGFRPEKNHDTFFAGLLQALADIPALKVIAVGAGPSLAQWRKDIAATELGARIVFTGDVADVVPYLWAMDVGCLTPATNEGFSNAVLEQMAVGLPMIVTAVGGNAEAVVDGESGRTIAPRDPAALARALAELYADPVRRAVLGNAARKRVEEKFSLEYMCAEHARLYRTLCGRGAAMSAHGADRA